MRKYLGSIFWQLIMTLMAALLILSAMVVIVLGQSRLRQIRADEEFFQIEAQSAAENLIQQQRELAIVAGQLNQNDLLQAFVEEENTLTRYRHSQYLKDLMHILQANSSQITGIDIFFLDGERFTVTDTEYQLAKEVMEVYDVTDSENKESVFMLLQPYWSKKHSQFAYVTPLYELTTGRKTATLALFGSCSRLLSQGSASYVSTWLTDADGHSYPEEVPEQADAYFPLNFGAELAVRKLRPYVDSSEAGTLGTLGTMLPMFVTMLLVLVSVGALLIRRLTNPVMKLSQQMELVRRNRQSSVETMHGVQELRVLCDGINDMLRTIEQRNAENMQIHDRLYQAELARVEAQLYALRNQINPHFLYNTLQTVRGMALACDAREIARIASCMAAIFRYAVQEDSLALLHEEMDTAVKYMEIMNIRQNNRFCYNWSMEHGIEDCMVPRMIVQPVIENAVKYAFEHAPEDAWIEADVRREGDDIRITLEDNGCGLSAEALAELQKRIQEPFSIQNEHRISGLGLHNIHQRLRLRYGEKYGLSIESAEGRGTMVVIRIPFLRDGKIVP